MHEMMRNMREVLFLLLIMERLLLSETQRCSGGKLQIREKRCRNM